jgi:signal transduction histidine kinase
MKSKTLERIRGSLSSFLLSVPVRVKIAGIMVIPVAILGLALNYWIRTGLSDWLSYLLENDRVAIAMQAGSRSVLTVSLIAAVGSILLTFILMYILTQPLIELRRTALQVQNGRLETRAHVWADDEIGEVASAINKMIDQLVSSQENLTRANQRLEAVNQVATAAVRDLDLHEVLKSSLLEMIRVLGLESGWVYLLLPDSQEFELACSSNLEAANLALDLLQNSGEMCACQQELMSGQHGKAILNKNCPRIQRTRGNCASRYHISIPLQARNQKFGIINLLYPNNLEPTEENIELLTTIGAQVSEMAANAWLHMRLVDKEASRQDLLNALINAQEGERSRLARELHDGPGQMLTSLLMRLKALGNKADSISIRSGVDDLCDGMSETIEQIKEISYLLRPAALEELGLTTAIHAMAQRIGDQFDFDLDYAIDDLEKLPLEIEIALYRITQESLNNIVRHAKATRVVIKLYKKPEEVCLCIQDNGVGFNPSELNSDDQRHYGLIGMRERANVLGGNVHIHSKSGTGTTIEVTIPHLERK